MNYRITAVAATLACLQLYNGARRELGPVRPRERVFHPVEVAVGTILSLPLYPAQIVERPHPLWLGWRVLPPVAPEAALVPAGARWRMSMRGWMGALARQLGMELGDAAEDLQRAVLQSLRRAHQLEAQHG